MEEKILLLVCEGETDVYIFEALIEHFSNAETQLKITSLAPQLDATSGTYPSHGFGHVLDWCAANRDNIQMFIDFIGAHALFIQMDTDIAKQIHRKCVELGHSARHCCQEILHQKLNIKTEPPRCHYILPTQNTETWILASHKAPELDQDSNAFDDYELIPDTIKRLIALGYPSKQGKRKLNKEPAGKYKKYGKQLVDNLSIAKQRCAELNRLCVLLEQQSI